MYGKPTTENVIAGIEVQRVVSHVPPPLKVTHLLMMIDELGYNK